MTYDKVLVFDIEAAGVQGLKADRGVMTHFGFKWLGKGRREVMSLHDFRGGIGRNGLDDTGLLKAASSILSDANGLVAHFGEYFDRPYVDSRFIQAGLPPIPTMKLTDTCLIAKRRLCLSSNRLANLAQFLKVDTQKMEKGRGWPDWWMGMLYGNVSDFESVRTYCGFDVQCLEDCLFKMLALIPLRDLCFNQAMGATIWTCPRCGGHQRQSRGYEYTAAKKWPRYQCVSKKKDGTICGGWVRGSRAVDSIPKV